MKKSSKKVLLANVFGTLGYFFGILSWSWVALLYLPAVLENEIVEDFLLPTPTEEVPAEPLITESSPIMIIFAAIVTVLVIVATIIILIKIPSTIAKTGKTVTTKAADSAVPLITRNHQLPPAQKKRLTANLIKLTKLLLILLPVCFTLLGVFAKLPLPYEVTVFVSSILALCALLWFSIQYILARLLGIDSKELV